MQFRAHAMQTLEFDVRRFARQFGDMRHGQGVMRPEHRNKTSPCANKRRAQAA